jgi:hypothetical protein
MSTTRIPDSVTVWRGPSAIDGSPIMVRVTGIHGTSTNGKTGTMAQVWILRDDKNPLAAVADGSDVAVCGACPFRPKDGVDRVCYVNLGQAPLSTFRAAQRNREQHSLLDVAEALRGKDVRLGAYGNPSAAPIYVMAWLSRYARMRTGYIHNYATADPRWRYLVMASTESAETLADARARGYRAFHVLPKDAPKASRPARAVECPADARGRSCQDCGACDGTAYGRKTGRVDIFIGAHGNGAKYV